MVQSGAANEGHSRWETAQADYRNPPAEQGDVRARSYSGRSFVIRSARSPVGVVTEYPMERRHGEQVAVSRHQVVGATHEGRLQGPVVGGDAAAEPGTGDWHPLRDRGQ